MSSTNTLETSDADADVFSPALADLHVSAAVLEPYSEGMVAAIDQLTDNRPDAETA